MSGNVKILFPMKSEKNKLNMVAGGAVKPVDSPLNAKFKDIQERCYSALQEVCRFVYLLVIIMVKFSQFN